MQCTNHWFTTVAAAGTTSSPSPCTCLLWLTHLHVHSFCEFVIQDAAVLSFWLYVNTRHAGCMAVQDMQASRAMVWWVRSIICKLAPGLIMPSPCGASNGEAGCAFATEVFLYATPLHSCFLEVTRVTGRNATVVLEDHAVCTLLHDRSVRMSCTGVAGPHCEDLTTPGVCSISCGEQQC